MTIFTSVSMYLGVTLRSEYEAMGDYTQFPRANAETLLSSTAVIRVIPSER